MNRLSKGTTKEAPCHMLYEEWFGQPGPLALSAVELKSGLGLRPQGLRRSRVVGASGGKTWVKGLRTREATVRAGPRSHQPSGLPHAALRDSQLQTSLLSLSNLVPSRPF